MTFFTPFLTSKKDADQNMENQIIKETFAKKKRWSIVLLVQKKIAYGRTDTLTWTYYSLYRDRDRDNSISVL